MPNFLERLLFGQDVNYWSDFAHWATGYRYVNLMKRPPETWSIALHQGSGWKYYVQPNAEFVSVPKIRWEVEDTINFRWPELFKGMITEKSDPGKANMYGQGSGYPMQMGTDKMRNVTYGWAEYGEHFVMKIPTPAANTYWISGAPTPSYDKTCCIVSPSGDVYELIQFDPTATETPFTSQALGIGKFRDLQLVEGKPTGAGQVSNSAYVWDRMSANKPHTTAIVLPDYNGHDGLLPATITGYDVPKIGDLFTLDPDSKSAREMIALGGDCAKLAKAQIKYGVRVVDRSGYSDVKNNKTEIGKQPHAATIMVQAGRWEGSNIGMYTIRIEDLEYVTSYIPE